MKIKGLQDFLQDDKDLSKEITYAEYINKKTAPGNSDHALEDAYEEFCSVARQDAK